MSLPFYVGRCSLANAIAVLLILPETVKRGEAAPASRGRIARICSRHSANAFRGDQSGLFSSCHGLLDNDLRFVLFTAYRYGYNAEQNGYLFAYVGVMAVVGQGVVFGTLASRFTNQSSHHRLPADGFQPLRLSIPRPELRRVGSFARRLHGPFDQGMPLLLRH